MGPFEFLHLAEERVQRNFPEWYVRGVKLEMAFEKRDDGYARTKKKADGTFEISLNEPTWDLCTVEDFALTLLHEFVHVKLWNELERTIPVPLCRSAIHELYAYRMELDQTKIRPTWATRRNAQFGYLDHYLRALVYCPERLLDNFPEPELSWNGETKE
jgi:hypothetical protein